jgi:hypothetical protein
LLIGDKYSIGQWRLQTCAQAIDMPEESIVACCVNVLADNYVCFDDGCFETADVIKTCDVLLLLINLGLFCSKAKGELDGLADFSPVSFARKEVAFKLQLLHYLYTATVFLKLCC